MCTVSWQADASGYRLFFNRDELRTRRPAAPPTVRERGGVGWIAPTDGDSGGSWIAVNAFGLSVFLLNGYAKRERPAPQDGWISRGVLVDRLADAATTIDVSRRLKEGDLQRFRSFTIGALQADATGILARWADGALSVRPLDAASMPLVSSSYDPDNVRRTRIARFRERVPRDAPMRDYLAFHASHDPTAGPYSVCMHRPDAQTVSFSLVTVDTGSVAFRYVPHAPHESTTLPPAIALPRRDARLQ